MKEGKIENIDRSKIEKPPHEDAYSFFERCREEAETINLSFDTAGRLLAPDNVTVSAYEKLRMRTPNTITPSETDPGILLAKIVRTPLFRSRFGDWIHQAPDASKVVYPETGEPMLLFHGTTHTIEPGEAIRDIKNKGRIFLSAEMSTPAQFADLDRGAGGTIHAYFAIIRKPTAENRQERDGVIGVPGKETVAVFSSDQLIALPMSFGAENPHEAIRFLHSL